jgi:transcriptional regulator with XRE-family HTH domain
MKQPVVSKHVRARRADSRDAEVGRRVRSRRLEQGLSQTELAEKIGVTFQQVQKYEKGTNRIGAGRLQRICEALGVNSTFFMDGAGPQQFATVFDKLQSKGAVQLLQAYSEIKSPKTRQLLVAMAKQHAKAA